MSNTIELRSIGALLGDHFFVPAYQRGYRWTKQQVEDLLNDIYNFTVEKKGSFYCLQPIIVKTNVDEEGKNRWEVVDGQQRLTTIKILLTYLYPKEVFSLNYETRRETRDFLDNIADNSNDDIDSYYISNVYKVIKEWFTNSNRAGADAAILNTLVNSEHVNGVVKVIWYQIDSDKNPIDTFIRINLGKIPLTNSELIKALFLQSGNFGKDSDATKLRQLEIATQWDMIENALQNDYFWSFLTNETPKAARIEFIFDLLCQQAVKKDPSLKAKIGNDELETFRYFYHTFETYKTYEAIKQAWSNIIDYFNIFQDWYTDTEQYHYIGFLTYINENIHTILSETKNKENKAETKEYFTESLKKLIKTKISITSLDTLVYPADRSKIKSVLLLFNVEYVVAAQRENDFFEYKFPFKAFKSGQAWDIEHVDSSTERTERTLTKKEDQIEWCKMAQKDLKDELEKDSMLANKIQLFLEPDNKDTHFTQLHEAIIELAGENLNDSAAKNSIGNLALLDASTNRAYGNALFRTKRRIIIEKDMAGTFIPLCTKNVFLKYFDSVGTSRSKWTKDDIENYKKVIAATLKDFIN